MRILLDTHVFIWWVEDSNKLSKAARNIIANADEAYISSASIWEIAIKSKIGKIEVDMNALINTIKKGDFLELPVSVKHAAATLELPDIHNDPFDRILISQAITEPLRFISADKKLREYSNIIDII